MFAARAKGAGAGSGTAGGGSPQASGAGQAEASEGTAGWGGTTAGGIFSRWDEPVPNKNYRRSEEWADAGDDCGVAARTGRATVTAVRCYQE